MHIKAQKAVVYKTKIIKTMKNYKMHIEVFESV